jgi:phosphoglycolate phosphatase
MLPMQQRLISFDLDGTLVDTAGEIAEAANRTLRDFGIAPRAASSFTPLIGHGHEVLIARLREEQPDALQRLPLAAMLERMNTHYTDTAGTMAMPYPDCDETLQALLDAGALLACITNKHHRFAQQVLDGSGLSHCFALVIGGDTLAARKPDAGPLRHALERFGVPASRAAHVGDSIIDIECARAADVAAWAVTWGYGSCEALSAAGAHRVFSSFQDLRSFALADQALATR